MRTSNYDLAPFVAVPGTAGAAVTGWDAIADRLREAAAARGRRRAVLVVECYWGLDEGEILAELQRRLQPAAAWTAASALRPPPEVDALVAPYLGGDDPVFGRIAPLELAQFFDPLRLAAIRSEAVAAEGLVLVVGCGARLIADGDVLVYADLSRREAQLRHRRGEAGNLGAANRGGGAAALYKRAFFIDWRVCDRWKLPLIAQWDFVLDLHEAGRPKLAAGEAVRQGLREAAHRPFRVVPFFDPAPWGGHWIQDRLQPGGKVPNYGWGFDCVPEENSLLLGLGDLRFEVPSLDLVLDQPEALLGAAVTARFGAEFPIRFDFLDTMGGGNLSLQVHPLNEYIRSRFGMAYTQDESYYLLDAGPGATVYLGLAEDVDRAAMMEALRAAEAGGAPFPADRFAARWPARKHDHFLIPAGTVHCSGGNAVVLEISATPYIFTFKLWDWGRPGLDGKPRPVHLGHGEANIQWERTAAWAKRNLINRFEPLAAGDGWREERTGLHELEFIETRRHWFTGRVPHDTRGTVNVLNLIEGEEALVESPSGAFAPFPVHFAETFIVPAAVGPYTVRSPQGRPCATLKAFVRS